MSQVTREKGDKVVAAVSTPETFTSHGEKSKALPDAFLANTEKADLRWFFSGAEASFGVCSNYGAMEHELNRRSPSPEALLEYREEKRLRSRLRRRKTHPHQTPLITLALALLGVAADRDPYSASQSLDDAVPEWAREYIHLKSEAVSPGAVEHLASDSVLAAIRQANHVRTRLVQVGSNWCGVLYAAYGPAARQAEIEAVGFPDHPANLLGNPSLVPIALAWLEYSREPGDPSGWEQLWNLGAARQVIQLHGGKGQLTKLDETRAEATSLWRRAVDAYRQTRCERLPGREPCRRCYPR